ncbi:hypothetical protein ACS0TY_035526 [Phlomoides rotata]
MFNQCFIPSSSDHPIDFSGDGSIPDFDVCPSPKKKPLLSDQWASIMKDGVGQEFMGGVEFRSEQIKYATHKGFNFKYTKNDNKYINVVCSELDSQGCDWFIRAKCKPINTHFVVSAGNLIHKCVGNLIGPENNRFGHNVLSNLVVQNIVSDPTIGASDIVKLMKDEYGVDITYWKAR